MWIRQKVNNILLNWHFGAWFLVDRCGFVRLVKRLRGRTQKIGPVERALPGRFFMAAGGQLLWRLDVGVCCGFCIYDRVCCAGRALFVKGMLAG
jgi:hypothetical protein